MQPHSQGFKPFWCQYSFKVNNFCSEYLPFYVDFCLNPLSADPGYIRDFRKILPFLLKSRFLLLSLHLYTKWICGFDAPINFEETGAKKVP